MSSLELAFLLFIIMMAGLIIYVGSGRFFKYRRSPLRRNHPNFESVIETAPGPSPWYLRGKSLPIERLGKKIKFEDPDADEITKGYSGYTLMKSESGELIGALNFCCYLQAVSGSRFLVWYLDEIEAPVTTQALKVLLMDAEKMLPRTFLEQVPPPEREVNRRFLQEGGIIQSLIVPIYLEGNKHKLAFPEEFKDFTELLMLVTADPPGRMTQDEMNWAIAKLYPSRDEFEITKLDWFNHSKADFGYEWPTQVARDPTTGKLFLAGIRFPDCILNEDGTPS